MAIDYVGVTTAQRPLPGTQLVRAANLTKELCELIDGLTAISDHMHDGADYALFVSKFGLVLPAGVTAANVKTLLGYMQEIFNSSTDVTGANRFARLREFVARFAGQ